MVRKAYVERSIFASRVFSLSLPCRFCLALYDMYEIINILSSSIYLFPPELIRIGCCASVAATTAYEDLAVVFG